MENRELRNDSLKQEWTDQYVEVKLDRQELKRFAGIIGRVVTVNKSNKALVDFQDGGWYDITASEEYLTKLDPTVAGPKYKNVNSAGDSGQTRLKRIADCGLQIADLQTGTSSTCTSRGFRHHECGAIEDKNERIRQADYPALPKAPSDRGSKAHPQSAFPRWDSGRGKLPGFLSGTVEGGLYCEAGHRPGRNG